MKFIHIADLHANKNRLEPCLKVLHTIRDYIKDNSTSKNDAPSLLIAGDFWDSTITNTENSGFTAYLDAMEEISNLSEVFMVAGTAHHEPASSLTVFKKLGIHVFNEPGWYSYLDEYRIFAIPEPRKANYSASSNEELVAAIIADLRTTLDSFKEEMKRFPKKINILLYHGEIKGSCYPNGQKVSDTSYAIPPAWLEELGMDYIACGHIHADMEVPGVTNCRYAGSCYPINFGETLDCGFNVIDIEAE